MPDATVTADQVPKDESALLDAMIESRLAAQGKTLVDAERIDYWAARVPGHPSQREAYRRRSMVGSRG